MFSLFSGGIHNPELGRRREDLTPLDGYEYIFELFLLSFAVIVVTIRLTIDNGPWTTSVTDDQHDEPARLCASD